MTRKLTQILRFVAVTAIIVLSAATIGAQESATLRIGVNSADSIDPAFQPNDPDTLFNRAIYDYLIDVLPDSSLAPSLASAWIVSDDELEYTFTLQSDVSFHDGSALSSADVVYTFNRLTEVGSPALGLLGEYTVSAPDDETVVFTLTQPNADFLYGIASRWALIIRDGEDSPNVLTETGSYENFNGTGAFIIESYNPGVGASFVRNPDYWREGLPLLDQIEHVYIDDPVAQVDALLSGEVDFIFKLPIEQISRLESAEGITLIEQSTSQHPVIRLRADQGFGTDVLVRQAFKLATDRDALNEIVLQGRGIVANNDPISPSYGVFFDETIEVPEYDPEVARALLAQAGYPDGISLTLYTPDSLGYADLAAVLQQQWAEAGINVEIVVRPENVYYSTDEWLTVDLGITGWGARPVPQQVLAEAYASTGIYNESHWFDEELDSLIGAASVTSDTSERAAIYSQIAQIFNERGPVIVPWFAPIISAARSNIQGLDVAPYPGSTDFRSVSVTNP